MGITGRSQTMEQHALTTDKDRLGIFGDALAGGRALNGTAYGENDSDTDHELVGRALNFIDRHNGTFTAALVDAYDAKTGAINLDVVSESINPYMLRDSTAQHMASFAVAHASEFIGPQQEGEDTFYARYSDIA